jgi:hypothetical protein
VVVPQEAVVLDHHMEMVVMVVVAMVVEVVGVAMAVLLIAAVAVYLTPPVLVAAEVVLFLQEQTEVDLLEVELVSVQQLLQKVVVQELLMDY